MKHKYRGRYSWHGRRISKRVRWLSSQWICYFIFNEEKIAWEPYHLCRQIGLDGRGNVVHTIPQPVVSLHNLAVYTLPTDDKESALILQERLYKLLNEKDNSWWMPAGVERSNVRTSAEDAYKLERGCVNIVRKNE